MTLSEEIIRSPMHTGARYIHRADVEREIRATAPPATDIPTTSAVERELALTRELLEAKRRRADRLDALLDEERQASAELRRLLARALGGDVTLHEGWLIEHYPALAAQRDHAAPYPLSRQ